MNELYTTSQVADLVREAIKDAAATVSRLSAENERLAVECERLRRYAGLARLLADMRKDAAEFELSANGPFLAAPFRRQAD
jgi:hypothetical protein